MNKLVVSLSLLALVPACTAATTESQKPDEEVASAEQAFGEAACATMSVADPTKGTVISGVTPTNTCWHIYGTSPDATYGTVDCPAQFVVEIPRAQMPTTLTDANFSYGVTEIGYYTNTQDACLQRHKTYAEYGRLGTSWTLLRTRHVKGAWNGSSPTSGYCTDEVVSSTTAPGVMGPRSYDALRFAVSAYTEVMVKSAPVDSPIQVQFWGQNDCIK